MKNFRCYQLAVEFYKACKDVELPHHFKDHLLRAASSIAMNLAEGRGKRTIADQKRFFQIAFGSVRECQGIFDLQTEDISDDLVKLLDRIAASVYRLLERA